MEKSKQDGRPLALVKRLSSSTRISLLSIYRLRFFEPAQGKDDEPYHIINRRERDFFKAFGYVKEGKVSTWEACLDMENAMVKGAISQEWLAALSSAAFVVNI